MDTYSSLVRQRACGVREWMNCVRVVGGDGLCTDQHSNMACCVARLDASISPPCHTAVGQCPGSNNSPWLHHTEVCSRFAGFHLVDNANPRPPGWNTWTAAAGSCVNVCNGHYPRLPALLRTPLCTASYITVHCSKIHHYALLQRTTVDCLHASLYTSSIATVQFA